MPEYSVSPNEVITKLVQVNPKQLGSKAHQRFECYRTGMTVQEFLDAGGEKRDIYNDIARSYIATSDFPYREIADRVKPLDS